MSEQSQSRALTLATRLDEAATRITEAVPQRLAMPAERVIRIAKQAINGNPQLAECTIPSVVNACIKAAADGLVCDGREAALVPFKGRGGVYEAQYIPMYRGLIKMMYRSGFVSTVAVHGVYQAEYDDPERWDYQKGDQERIMHRPILLEERGKIVLFYAIVGMRDGSKVHKVMSIPEIMETVGRAATINPLWKLPDDGRQTHNWQEMCKKTPLRAVSKLLPFESDIAAAFDDHGATFDEYEPDTEAGPGEPEIQPPRKKKGAAAEKLNPKPAPAAEQFDAETGELAGAGEVIEGDQI